MIRINRHADRTRMKGVHRGTLPADTMITFELPDIPGRHEGGYIDIRIIDRQLEITCGSFATMVVLPASANQVWLTTNHQHHQIVAEHDELIQRVAEHDRKHSPMRKSRKKDRRRK
jgi:hypothetical protein